MDKNEKSGENTMTSEFIQNLIKEVNTDHENAKKWASEIASTTNNPS